MSAYLRALGLAYVPGADEIACDSCGGSGQRAVFDAFGDPYGLDCIDCGATGYVAGPPPACPLCDKPKPAASICPSCEE